MRTAPSNLLASSLAHMLSSEYALPSDYESSPDAGTFGHQFLGSGV